MLRRARRGTRHVLESCRHVRSQHRARDCVCGCDHRGGGTLSGRHVRAKGGQGANRENGRAWKSMQGKRRKILCMCVYALLLKNQVCHSQLAHSKSIVTPSETSPQPINRQCFSTRRLRAIFSPTRVHTGDRSLIFATLTSPLPSPSPSWSASSPVLHSSCCRC